nr:MGMT family protein [Sulfobacillus harzensis]
MERLCEDAFGGRAITFSLFAGELTPLEQALLSTATEIPFGSTASYGTVAHWAGFPGRARAAGRAMSHSPLAYFIPTHRVIRADGSAAACQRDPLNDRLRAFEGIVLFRRSGGIMRPIR